MVLKTAIWDVPRVHVEHSEFFGVEVLFGRASKRLIPSSQSLIMRRHFVGRLPGKWLFEVFDHVRDVWSED